MINLDISGIKTDFLVVVIKLLTVDICAKLCAENALRAKTGKGDSRACALAAGNISNSAVVNNGFSCLGATTAILKSSPC